MTTREQKIMEALKGVDDPELHRDIVSLGMVKGLVVEQGRVTVTVNLTTPACPMKHVFREQIEKALLPIEGVEQVALEFTASVARRQASGPDENLIPDVAHTILVGSGKGGVGKSTVSLNIALALLRQGAKVGLLDADIYGPSLPTMLNARMTRPDATEDRKRLIPVDFEGLKVMSLGFLIDPDSPVIWRGPMLQKIITQFLGEVEWGKLDYLVVDLPPGTGDVQLAFSQMIRPTGVVLVTTPQDVALADVYRAKHMFDKVNIPVLGVVENMSDFVCPGCGERHAIFAGEGAQRVGRELGVRVLGKIPLHPAISAGGDSGRPAVLAEPESAYAMELVDIATRIAGEISIRSHGC